MKLFHSKVLGACVVAVCCVVLAVVMWQMLVSRREVPPLSNERELGDYDELSKFTEAISVPWMPEMYKVRIFVVASTAELRKLYIGQGCSEVKPGFLTSMGNGLPDIIPDHTLHKFLPLARCLYTGRPPDLAFVKSVYKYKNGRYFWRLPLRDKTGRPIWALVNESHGAPADIDGPWRITIERKIIMRCPDHRDVELYIM